MWYQQSAVIRGCHNLLSRDNAPLLMAGYNAVTFNASLVSTLSEIETVVASLVSSVYIYEKFVCLFVPLTGAEGPKTGPKAQKPCTPL